MISTFKLTLLQLHIICSAYFEKGWGVFWFKVKNMFADGMILDMVI